MKAPLDNPPPIGHPDRAEWNRRLDDRLSTQAATVAAHAAQAKAEALRRGDRAAAVHAATMERKARRMARAGRG